MDGSGIPLTVHGVPLLLLLTKKHVDETLRNKVKLYEDL